METRRTVLKTLMAASAAVSVPVTAVIVGEGDAARPHGRAGSAPPPWWLLDPLKPGFKLGLGWFLGELTPVVDGAAILTLVHDDGRLAHVHLCAREGSGVGVASTALFDLVLMDGHAGSDATDEDLGRVVLGLSEVIAKNEVDPAGDLRAVVWMQQHDERVAEYGAEALLANPGQEKA